MRIGQIAEITGVNARTLRYYEQIGLLEEPQRRDSGYREYTAETVSEIRFIKKVQELGFSLKEIEEFIRLRRADETACQSAWAFVQSKLQVIEEKLKSLTALKLSLESLLESCPPSPVTGECTPIEGLLTPPEHGSQIGNSDRPIDARPDRTDREENRVDTRN